MRSAARIEDAIQQLLAQICFGIGRATQDRCSWPLIPVIMLLKNLYPERKLII